MSHKPYIREIAGSDTAVLFIHGILGTPEHFRDFIPLVPASWSIFNILLDGHGKTAKDFSHSSMEQWKSQVSRIMHHLSEQYDHVLIVAHSMGTLFALSEAVAHREKVRGLFLMAVPLKLFLRASAPLNSLKVIFDRVSEEDAVAVAARNAYSMEPSRKVWSYAGWLPRYMELFKEIKRTRGLLPLLDVPCYVFQSENDELVSMNTIRYLQGNRNVEVSVLRRSRHFYYHPEDYAYLLEGFQSFVERNLY